MNVFRYAQKYLNLYEISLRKFLVYSDYDYLAQIA